MQYSVVSSWRARAKAMKEDSEDRKEVKEAIEDGEKSPEEETDDEENSDNNEEDSEEENDEEDDEEYEDDEIDIGSHIGLLLDDEEVFGVIIEFDDDEGLVTIEEDGTGDLVTGYQDDMFIDD